MTTQTASITSALEDMIEAAQSLLNTCTVIRGKAPEDADIYEHEDWTSVELEKAIANAKAALAALTKAEGRAP